MTRRFSTDTPWEPVVGYSRAVAAGDTVYVTGCTSTRDGEIVHENDLAAQTAQALANVATALAAFGLDVSSVVRTRIYVRDISRWETVGRVHGEVFADVMPATSMVEVSALIDPRLLVEIEAVAYAPGLGA